MESQDVRSLSNNLELLNKTNGRIAQQQSYFQTLVRGVFYGIGATAGAAVVLAIMVSLLNWISGVDFFRPAAQSVLPYVENRSLLPKSVFPEPTYEASEALPTPDEDVSLPSPSTVSSAKPSPQ